MYTNEKVKSSYEKFMNYLKEHIDVLSAELDEYNKKHTYYEAISELKTNPTLETVLKSRKFLVSLNPEISKYFNVIDFFMSRGAKNAPQIDIALKSIMDINEIKSFTESTNSSLNVSLIKEELDHYVSLLNGINLDIDYLVSVLDRSGLSDKEQIDVLSKVCFEGIPEKKIEEKIEEEKSKTKEENMDKAIIGDKENSEEMISIESLLERCTLMLPKVAEIRKKYEYLVKNKSQSQIKYSTAISVMYNSNQLSFEEVENYSNELLMTFYLTIFREKQNIDELISKSVDDMLPKSDYEFLELCVNDLEHAIKQFVNISNIVNEKEKRKEEESQKEQEENASTRKLIFLIDSRGKCVVDFDKFRRGEVESLFDKCKRGLWRKEYKIGPGCEFSVLMNNVSKTACSYIELSNRYNLVIDLSHISDAHDRAVDRASKNQAMITEFMHVNDNDLENIYTSQDELRKDIEVKYNISTESVEVTL